MAYAEAWALQNTLATARGRDEIPDRLLLVEHPHTYTFGSAVHEENLLLDDQTLQARGIAVFRTDRGGDITYHGPGQLVGYLMLDLQRRGGKVREMVHLIEQAVIDCLAGYGVEAVRKDGAPGVYVDGAKIAALGLRVRNGCSYHGLSLNVDMDLAPFTIINPCGYSGLKTVQLCHFGVSDSVGQVGENLLAQLERLMPPLNGGNLAQ
ncbi:MAG: lipoyl(octanoyl) transferase LipB [Xanthomonadales bacterium]|nr:lipoyl(octanoyl) transferase LipB [Xanthomonadales bacterium]